MYLVPWEVKDWNMHCNLTDVFSPSPCSSSFFILNGSFLFCGPLPALEKANFCCFFGPSPPLPGLLFLSVLLYGLEGFLPPGLLPGFPPSLAPMESGQSETCRWPVDLSAVLVQYLYFTWVFAFSATSYFYSTLYNREIPYFLFHYMIKLAPPQSDKNHSTYWVLLLFILWVDFVTNTFT